MSSNILTNSKMFSNLCVSKCGFSAFPVLFQRARGIKSPWSLHQKSANTDQWVLLTSYGIVQPASSSSLHNAGVGFGCCRGLTQHHAAIRSPHNGIGERIRGEKKKGKKSRENNDKRISKASDSQCNCSPHADQCPAKPQSATHTTIPPPTCPPHLHCSAWLLMV